MSITHLIAVGACAVDTILSVPEFPKEDSKLRALKLVKRRGGNCPNSLEVLAELRNAFGTGPSWKDTLNGSNIHDDPHDLRLSLLATLPARSSPHIPFIASSFGAFEHKSSEKEARPQSADSSVDISMCIHREEYLEPVSSYIISSQATSSRTIVNHNELPEMTFEEFIEVTKDVLLLPCNSPDRPRRFWFHFEGRIADVILQCIKYLRSHAFFQGGSGASVSISVELEKPLREGLQELAFLADTVFYSRSWAEAQGYSNAEDCIEDQARLFGQHEHILPVERTLICTWGDQGACALSLPARYAQLNPTQPEITAGRGRSIVRSQAYTAPDATVVDTVGAGDTFIAGMLFGLTCRNDIQLVLDKRRSTDAKILGGRPTWKLQQQLDFANGLAGRKILQNGFQGLTEQIQFLLRELDET